MNDSTPVSATKDWLIPLTYIVPIVFIYTMIKKGSDSNYVWHSKNAIGMIATSLMIQIIYRVLWSFLSVGFLFQLLNFINLVFLVLMVYGAWQAWNGKLPKLPVITQLGQKFPLEKWFKKSATDSTLAPASSPALAQATLTTPVVNPTLMNDTAPVVLPAPIVDPAASVPSESITPPPSQV